MTVRTFSKAAVLLVMTMTAGPALAQKIVAYSPGANYDQMSWQSFVSVVTPAPNGQQGLTLETWATDPDTFQATPTWPSGPSLTATAAVQRPRFQASLLQRARARGHAPAGLRGAAAVSVGGCNPVGDAAAGNFPTGNASDCIAEEVRRNRDAFDYIVNNGLYTQAGLKTAFAGPGINFPTSAIELKLDWIQEATLVTWLNNNGVQTPNNFVQQNYYTTVVAGTTYALLSMHISTKQLPNWLWATFEHQLNPGRCDTMGCYDQFGVTGKLTSVAALPTPKPGATQNQYPACVKSPALAAMFSGAGLGAVWNNYCLKATQVDFLSTQNATIGQPVIDGDSVIERITADVPIAQSSCITCHAYAAVTAQGCVSGKDNPGLGSPGPVGLVNWAYLQKQKMYDFVWGVININGEKGSVCP
jgi:hypothetical protein